MASRAILLCASSFLIQHIAAQCFDRPTPAFSQPASTPPTFVRTVVGSDGCPLTITCACPISPNGVSVQGELGIQGQLAVSGSLPFLSAVSLDGSIPTVGQATVSYACGDGSVAITRETGSPCGANAAVANGISLNSLVNARK